MEVFLNCLYLFVAGVFAAFLLYPRYRNSAWARKRRVKRMQAQREQLWKDFAHFMLKLYSLTPRERQIYPDWAQRVDVHGLCYMFTRWSAWFYGQENAHKELFDKPVLFRSGYPFNDTSNQYCKESHERRIHLNPNRLAFLRRLATGDVSQLKFEGRYYPY